MTGAGSRKGTSGRSGKARKAAIPPSPAPKAAANAAVAPALGPKAAPARSILKAMDDPNLFAPHFKGPSWRAWRVFLASLFALPMDDKALAVYRARTGRETPPAKAFTEAALIVGRRGGKSRVLATIAVFLACFRDYTPHLAPGEVATVMIIATDRKQARSIFRFVSGLLKSVPLLAPKVVSETDDSISLDNRVVIEIGTASFRVTRGYSFAAVLADEVAFWRSDETSANPDTEILRALRPGMANIPGSILLLASSPYAKKGALYDAYRRHHGKDNARVLVWKADTATMNPAVPPEIIAEAYEDDPESARAEYGAEFRDDLADFVTREIVDAVTCWGRRELPPELGITYHAFCDPSGGSNDSMTLAVAHLRDGVVGVLDAVLEIRPPFDPDVAVAECAALLKRFGVARVFGDHYAGLWPVARFAEHGITFIQSARPKSDLYRDLLPLLNAKRIELLEHQRLSAQLVGLERRTARSGRDSIDHSPGGHDDIVNCVAGVLVGLDLDRRPALVRGSDLLEDGSPVPLPRRCDTLFAVLTADQHGLCATLYVSTYIQSDAPVTILDFAVQPMGAALFDDILARLTELAELCPPTYDVTCIYTDQTLARHAQARGLNAELIPPEYFTDPSRLALSAAAHVSAGRVRIAAPAHERAESSPFGGALDVRGGEATADDPLRAALLAGIAIALDDASVFAT